MSLDGIIPLRFSKTSCPQDSFQNVETNPTRREVMIIRTVPETKRFDVLYQIMWLELLQHHQHVVRFINSPRVKMSIAWTSCHHMPNILIGLAWNQIVSPICIVSAQSQVENRANLVQLLVYWPIQARNYEEHLIFLIRISQYRKSIKDATLA